MTVIWRYFTIKVTMAFSTNKSGFHHATQVVLWVGVGTVGSTGCRLMMDPQLEISHQHILHASASKWDLLAITVPHAQPTTHPDKSHLTRYRTHHPPLSACYHFKDFCRFLPLQYPSLFRLYIPGCDSSANSQTSKVLITKLVIFVICADLVKKYLMLCWE